MTGHAAEALETVREAQREDDTIRATLLVGDAQVHALLALVDEQRKTNTLLEQLVAQKTATITVGHVSSNLTDEAREAIAAEIAWRNQAGGL